MATKSAPKPKPQAGAKAPAKAVVVKAKKEPKPKSDAPRFYGTGRRKSSVARVWIASGAGRIVVNGKSVEDYFARPVLRMIINQPFATLNRLGNFDVNCTVVGGGLSGQAGAVRLGISRALDQVDSAFHTPLRQGGFLTRDSRIVERKKYGRRKARRSFQFSKR